MKLKIDSTKIIKKLKALEQDLSSGRFATNSQSVDSENLLKTSNLGSEIVKDGLSNLLLPSQGN